MHPSLEQLEECLPVFRHVDEVIRSTGINVPPGLDIHRFSSKNALYFNIGHRVEKKAMSLHWRIKCTGSPNTPNSHWSTSIIVWLWKDVMIGSKNRFLCLNVTYKPAMNAWYAELSTSIREREPYPSNKIVQLAKKSNVHEEPSRIDDAKALDLICEMAEIVL